MIVNVQAARGLAAVGVLGFHAVQVGTTYGHDPRHARPLGDLGMVGVDLFFVISGFIILHTQFGRRRGATGFLRQRLARILPLYWAMTAAFVLAYLAFPAAFRGQEMDWSRVRASFVMMSQVLVGAMPTLYLGWTLEYEMAFYGLFALMLALPAGLPIVAAGTGAGLVLAAAFSGKWILLEFGLGLFAAWIHHRRPPGMRTGSACLLGGASLLLIPLAVSLDGREPLGSLLVGAGSFLLVLGAASVPGVVAKSGLLVRLGNASYSIYLSQVFSVSLFYKGVGWLGLRLSGDGWAALCLGFGILAGLMVHHAVELPLAAFTRRLIGGPGQRSASGSVA